MFLCLKDCVQAISFFFFFFIFAIHFQSKTVSNITQSFDIKCWSGWLMCPTCAPVVKIPAHAGETGEGK